MRATEEILVVVGVDVVSGSTFDLQETVREEPNRCTRILSNKSRSLKRPRSLYYNLLICIRGGIGKLLIFWNHFLFNR